MVEEFLISDEELEAAAEHLIDKYQTGKFLNDQVICPTNDIAHHAFIKFRKHLELKKRPEDIIIEISPERLTEIQTDSRYINLRDIGFHNIYSMCVYATLFDYASQLDITTKEILQNLKDHPAVNYLSSILKQKQNYRALFIFDDFIDTINCADSLGIISGDLPCAISRRLGNTIVESKKFSMVGFTRPNKETRLLIKKGNQTSNGYDNDIACLNSIDIQLLAK
jgi:hypothetical protein